MKLLRRYESKAALGDRLSLQHLTEEPPPQSPPFDSGAGFVIAAGDWRYLPSLYVTCHMIRRTGSPLPISIWYQGKRHGLACELLKRFNVTWINADEYTRTNPEWMIDRLDSSALKTIAIACAPFQQVIYLDADAYPVSNPGALLETTEFKQTGALFFPDPHTIQIGSDVVKEAWSTFASSKRSGEEWDAGLMVLDKSCHWKAICMAWRLQRAMSDLDCAFLERRPDPYRVAVSVCSNGVSVAPPPVRNRAALIHKDFSGRGIVVHRRWSKFAFDFPDPRFVTQQLPQHAEEQLPGNVDAQAGYREFTDRIGRADLLELIPSGLLIMGAARSLTSEVYRIACRSLALQQANVKDGEILNSHWNRNAPNSHYSSDEEVRTKCWTIIDNHLGEIVKDVSQPSAVIGYLEQYPWRWKTLYVHRNADDIRARQVARWGQHAQPHPREWENPYRAIADVTVEYDEIIWDCNALFNAFEDLGFQPFRYDYLSTEFVRKRDTTVAQLSGARGR